MSRAYRVSLSESLRRHVRVGDGVQTGLEVLPVLPKERMAALLAAELEKLGFEREGGVCRREQDGIAVEVDLLTGCVTATASAETDLSLQREGVASSYRPDELERAAESRRQRLRDSLEAEAAAHSEELRQQVTARLEAALRELQAELDGAVNRSTASALKEKAAQLGEIEEISEDTETGELTIRVRL